MGRSVQALLPERAISKVFFASSTSARRFPDFAICHHVKPGACASPSDTHLHLRTLPGRSYTPLCVARLHTSRHFPPGTAYGVLDANDRGKKCNMLLHVRNVVANRTEMCLRPFFRKRSVLV